MEMIGKMFLKLFDKWFKRHDDGVPPGFVFPTRPMTLAELEVFDAECARTNDPFAALTEAYKPRP